MKPWKFKIFHANYFQRENFPIYGKCPIDDYSQLVVPGSPDTSQ